MTTDVRKDIPQSLSNVILRATEKDKANRYKTIQEMKDDLSSVLHENRANEDVYELDKMKTIAVPLKKEDLAKHISEHKSDQPKRETTQVPIVNGPAHHQQFQKPEGTVYNQNLKRNQHERLCSYH